MTREQRDPWERLGGTPFHFVKDGIETALDQVRASAGDRTPGRISLAASSWRGRD